MNNIRYSWTWVYASIYTGILFLLFGEYLPNSIVTNDTEELGSLIFVILLLHIPSLVIYFKTAKEKNRFSALKRILKIELIAFCLGVGMFIIFSCLIIGGVMQKLKVYK